MARERFEWPSYVPKSTKEGRISSLGMAKCQGARCQGISLEELARCRLEVGQIILTVSALDADEKLDPVTKFEVMVKAYEKLAELQEGWRLDHLKKSAAGFINEIGVFTKTKENLGESYEKIARHHAAKGRVRLVEGYLRSAWNHEEVSKGEVYEILSGAYEEGSRFNRFLSETTKAPSLRVKFFVEACGDKIMATALEWLARKTEDAQ